MANETVFASMGFSSLSLELPPVWTLAQVSGTPILPIPAFPTTAHARHCIENYFKPTVSL